MGTAINRLPREVSVLDRIVRAHRRFEQAQAELAEIKLTEIPVKSPVRQMVKDARANASEGVKSTGESIQKANTLRRTTTRKHAA